MSDLTPAATPVTIAVVDAGVSDPSSPRLLADRIAQKTVDTLRASGTTATVRSIGLGPLATDIAQGIASGMLNPAVQSAMELLASADAVIAATPVYKAGVSGLFKSFADLIDNDLLIAKPIVLAATGGSARHAMVVDEQLRPLFAFLRAIPMPTSLYAAPEDWGSTDLGKRIARAAQELSVMLRSGAGRQIADSERHLRPARLPPTARRPRRAQSPGGAALLRRFRAGDRSADPAAGDRHRGTACGQQPQLAGSRAHHVDDVLGLESSPP
ncbi:CE1759 family FMN reductase [Streptomyces sp. NPDC127197]|uniref:CE1759 family FMN reductase n=1 Tax=Streptomyces sp. NPDC127197 TaxID=3345388 RepID=UPI00363545A3